MKFKELLKAEIQDMAQRIQTHIDEVEKEYEFFWGDINFFIHEDDRISVYHEELGNYTFMSPVATAEFVLLNVIPKISK